MIASVLFANKAEEVVDVIEKVAAVVTEEVKKKEETPEKVEVQTVTTSAKNSKRMKRFRSRVKKNNTAASSRSNKDKNWRIPVNFDTDVS